VSRRILFSLGLENTSFEKDVHNYVNLSFCLIEIFDQGKCQRKLQYYGNCPERNEKKETKTCNIAVKFSKNPFIVFFVSNAKILRSKFAKLLFLPRDIIKKLEIFCIASRFTILDVWVYFSSNGDRLSSVSCIVSDVAFVR
jgi:hypothetical protein